MTDCPLPLKSGLRRERAREVMKGEMILEEKKKIHFFHVVTNIGYRIEQLHTDLELYKDW